MSPTAASAATVSRSSGHNNIDSALDRIMAKQRKRTDLIPAPAAEYGLLVSAISDLLDQARRAAARAVNRLLTATYWEVGRRIVEFEQGGRARAEYGEGLWKRLARDLTAKYGRGFSKSNLAQMRSFYLGWEIFQTSSGKSEARARGLVVATDKSPASLPALTIPDSVGAFALPWSHYVRLLAVENPHARQFYEAEALRGGWSVRQLDRQVNSLFYERSALSKNKAAMLQKGQSSRPGDSVSAEEEIRDPYVLEFLNLKDEYSESDLEDALIRHLETFLFELGDDFTFVGRQKRLRIDDQWFRVDLVFFHRGLRALIVIDLKMGPFTHADAGQMHLYLNYARTHWVRSGENPPVGLILCTQKEENVARYALEGLPNKVLAATYRTTLPDESVLVSELERTRALLEERRAIGLSRKSKKR
jgi:predicted nuclease of restriction endonuclease-like (RecB) superfamily